MNPALQASGSAHDAGPFETRPDRAHQGCVPPGIERGGPFPIVKPRGPGPQISGLVVKSREDVQVQSGFEVAQYLAVDPPSTHCNVARGSQDWANALPGMKNAKRMQAKRARNMTMAVLPVLPEYK
jgi:hypothetical protein